LAGTGNEEIPLKKIRSWRRLVGTEQRMLCGTREMLTERLHDCGLRARIQTAFAERVNLPLRQAQGKLLRQSVAGLVRRTWSMAVAPADLEGDRITLRKLEMIMRDPLGLSHALAAVESGRPISAARVTQHPANWFLRFRA